MTQFFLSDDSFYLMVNKNVTPILIQKKIEECTGMRKDSFADYYVKKIISRILCGATNLFQQYSKYYAVEYDSFEDYLFKKELLDKEFIVKVSDLKNEILWKLNLSGNDYLIKNLLNPDCDYKNIIESMIKDLIYED